MISFILFVGLIIVLLWVSGLSNRIAKLEQQTRFLSPEAVPPRPPQPAIAPAILPPVSIPNKAATPLSKSEEAEVASGWLSKIGVLALLFGIAFFFKFAIDQGWISQWTRIIIGLATGSLLIILGEIWKEKYHKYAPVLTGGGVALLYFTIFAAYQFYSLLPQAVAFACMIVISAVAVGLSYRYKSVPLAILSTAGAYLSPILLHSNIDQQTKLFAYLVLLNVAALAILAKHFWIELLYLSLFGTAVDYILWASNYSSQANTVTSLVFLTVMIALWIFGGTVLLRKTAEERALTEKTDSYFSLLYLFYGIFYTAMIMALLFERFHSLLPLAGLFGAVVVLLAYVYVDRLEHSKINYSLAFLGVALAVLSAVWQYDGNYLNFMVMIMGFAGVSIGVLTRRAELRFWGMATLLVSLLLVLFAPYVHADYVFLLNAKFGLMILQAAVLLCISWLYRFVDMTEQERHADSIARLVAVFLVWLALSWELVTYFRNAPSHSTASLLLSLWWIIYATIIITIGALGRSSMLRKAAIVLFGLSILKVFLYDVQALELGYRVVSFIVLGLILLAVSFAYQKNREKITEFLEGGKAGNKTS